MEKRNRYNKKQRTNEKHTRTSMKRMGKKADCNHWQLMAIIENQWQSIANQNFSFFLLAINKSEVRFSTRYRAEIFAKSISHQDIICEGK